MMLLGVTARASTRTQELLQGLLQLRSHATQSMMDTAVWWLMMMVIDMAVGSGPDDGYALRLRFCALALRGRTGGARAEEDLLLPSWIR